MGAACYVFIGLLEFLLAGYRETVLRPPKEVPWEVGKLSPLSPCSGLCVVSVKVPMPTSPKSLSLYDVVSLPTLLPKQWPDGSTGNLENDMFYRRAEWREIDPCDY